MNKTSEMLDKSLEKSRKIGKSSQKPPENDNFGVQTTAFWGTGLYTLLFNSSSLIYKRKVMFRLCGLVQYCRQSFRPFTSSPTYKSTQSQLNSV